MRRSTELVFMIVGCAALVVAAVVLPALLLAPPARDQWMKASAPEPRAEARLPAEPTRLPPVAQTPDPPLPPRDVQPGEVPGNSTEPPQRAGPAESTGTVDPGAPREVAKTEDRTTKPSDEVAAVTATEPKETTQPDQTARAIGADVPSDGATPADRVAALPAPEPDQPVKPEASTAGSAAANAASGPSGDIERSEQNTSRVPSEPSAGAGTDLKMPTVEPPAPSDIGAAPKLGESSAKVAAIQSGEPAERGRASDQASTVALSARQSARVRTPWWCSNPRGEDVEAVCANRELLALDAELNALYAKLMAREENVELRNAQRQWLAERQNCGADVSCLKHHYKKRIDELARL
jgi:uncharacterized protein YecT (DUF1311 family)